MKKVFVILSICVVCAQFAFAQLKVNSLGQVGIGTIPQFEGLEIAGNIYFKSASNFLGTNANSIPVTFKVNNRLAGTTGYSGNSNVSFGYETLPNLNSGDGNTATGYYALHSNSEGYFNTATGSGTLFSNRAGSYNTSNGYLSLNSNLFGSYNTANGSQALYSNTTGDSNTANGADALYNNTVGYLNTAIGNLALYRNESGYYNTAIGAEALFYNEGNAPLNYAGGYENTAIGYRALYNNTSGYSNTVSGSYALYDNVTGWYNTVSGYNAFSGNVIGNFNTAVGSYTSVDGHNRNNVTVIGYGACATGNNEVVIGNNAIYSARISVMWSTTSDGRAKKNIQTKVPGLAFINRLQPVTYNLNLNVLDELQKSGNSKTNASKNSLDNALSSEAKEIMAKAKADKEKIVYSGFIAQDVEKTAHSIGYDFNGVDTPENGKGIYGLRYAEFVVPLVKAVQELSEQNSRLQEQINELNGTIYNLLEKEDIPNTMKSPSQNVAISGLMEPAVNAPASLQQNIPNPFSQSTQIRYYLPETVSTAFLCIYNLQGKQLKQISIVERGEGMQTISGSEFSAGIYLYALLADGKEVDVKRMILTE